MNRIKELRKNKHLTQVELAEKMNVAQSAVCKWEKDLSIPDILTLKKLTTFFDVTIDYLIGENDIIKSPTQIEEEKPITVAPKKMVARTFTPEQMKVLEELLQAIKDENDNK